MTHITPEAKQESDTPIADAYRTAAMFTTANDWLFRIERMERQLATVTAERDRLQSNAVAYFEKLKNALDERDALKVEAERYRWLRYWMYVDHGLLEIGSNIPCTNETSDDIKDAAIDAARAK